MRRDRRILLGIVLGLLAAPLLFALRGDGAGRGAVLSDCDGRIREIVIHYVSGAAPRVGRAYREFLGGLPSDVVVRVVTPDAAAFDELRETVGELPPALRPVIVGHPTTVWSRDRWLARAGAGGATSLLLPAAEDGAASWPPRAGDSLVGTDLAAALAGVTARRSSLGFDGGDFVADSETVFVAPRVGDRNGREGLAEALAAALRRRVVLLDRAPPYHAGMYMMPAGERRVVVGDPSLARGLLSPAGDPNPVGTDFSPELQARFDAVAKRCEAEGYRVVRMPVLPGRDGRTWLTPLNVLIDGRPGGRVVHLPVYRTAPALNEAAARIWAGLGYEVRPVDCTETFPLFGSLRCLVNVLRRD